VTDLRLYNTLTRSIEPLVPREPGRVTVYSCGPTVYSRQHLGNMRPYVLADLLTRVLRLEGLEVSHVINITDVGHLTDDADDGDDKLELAARRSGSSALEVARVWTELFKRDLALLDVREPNVWAKATEHIPEQLEMIRLLEAKGLTYRTVDGLYFDTAKDPGYGALSGLKPSVEHARIASDAKHNPADFALWKLSSASGPRRQLEWPSPWGVGFPGWHIECSAMASKYLGPQIDIHTGGVDHVAVHHTNEIAQAENALDSRPWVQFWLHGAWLLFDGHKISKSRGHEAPPPNLDDLAPLGVTPGGFRYYLYTAHYRSPLSLSGEALRGAEAARRRLRAIVRAGGTDAPRSSRSARLEELRQRFRAALLDDLDAPRALALLWEVADQPDPLPERAFLLRELGDSIGLSLTGPAPVLEDDALIDEQVARRNQARKDRDFALSDALRAELSSRGIVLEDSPEGSTWRRA
jgi:cysteinyl-tRNA synthetase